jgi:hypothetical protein
VEYLQGNLLIDQAISQAASQLFFLHQCRLGSLRRYRHHNQLFCHRISLLRFQHMPFQQEY